MKGRTLKEGKKGKKLNFNANLGIGDKAELKEKQLLGKKGGGWYGGWVTNGSHPLVGKTG